MSRNVLNTYNFVSTSDRRRPLDSDHYQLVIRQQPKIARLCSSKERDRRPVDPPPIIQLKVDGGSNEAQNFLQSPYYFMCANLVRHTGNSDLAISSRFLAGTVVSSLHKLKDIDNTDGGFFVFGDISVRVEGRYRLQFSLFEIIGDEVVHIRSLMSDVFTVYPPKTFPGMSESTFLSRSFSDQGVRIRIRKEHRIQMKRPTSSRHSDVADGEDNVNDDGVDPGEVPRRKRSRCSSSPPVELRSMGSPYYQQSSSSHPTNDGNGRTNSLHCPPPPNENSPYELSSSSSPLLSRRSRDYESAYSCYDDDHMLTRSGSNDVTSTPQGSSKPEFPFPSDDPRPFSQSCAYSRLLRPPHSPYKPQRRTTLPPLLEHPDSSFSSRPQFHDTITSLDSSRNFNASYQTTNSSSSQFPSNYSNSPQLFPVKTPIRSKTLPLPPYIDSQRQHHHHHTVDSERSSLSFANQLPTPRTSFDSQLNHPPRTSPNTSTSLDSYKDSYSNNDNSDSAGNVNITVPRFTQHFTLSPRPSHGQLSSSPPLPINNIRSTSGSSTMSIISGAPSSSPRLLTTPLHSTTTTTTTTTTRLPPISALTDNLGINDFLRRNESSTSIITTPSSSSPSTMMTNGNNGSTNHFQSDQLLSRHYYQRYNNANDGGAMIQNRVHHFAEQPTLSHNMLASPASIAQDSVRSWNGGYLA